MSVYPLLRFMLTVYIPAGSVLPILILGLVNTGIGCRFIAKAVLILGGAALGECKRKATNCSKGYSFVYQSKGHYAENPLDKSRLR